MKHKRYRKPIAVIAALTLVAGLFPTGALGEIAGEAFDQQQVSDIILDEEPVVEEAVLEDATAEAAPELQYEVSAADEATEPEPWQGASDEAAPPEGAPAPTAQAETVISNVTFVVTPPEVGTSSEYAPTVTVPSGAGYAISDSGWFNADGSYKEPTDPNYKFEAGKTYKFFVDLTADDDKDFADSVTAAVNGGTLEGAPDVYNSDTLSALSAVISVSVTAKSGNYTDEQGVNFSYEKLAGSVQDSKEYCAITRISLAGVQGGGGTVDVTIPTSMEGLTVYSLGAEDVNLDYYDGYKIGSITVPASVQAISGPCFKNDSYRDSPTNLKSVTFESGSRVTELPSEAFANSTITNVTLPEGLTAIGDSTFISCKNLTSIDVPARVRTIGEKAFYNCESLVAIQLHEGLSTIGKQAFASDYGRMSYTTIAIPNSVTSIGESAFDSSLESVSLGTSMTESKLTEIGAYAFSATKLTSVEIPNSVETIGERAFYCEFDRGVGGKGHGVSTLASVTLGTSQAESQLRTIGPSAFGASAITTITLPNGLQALETTDTYGVNRDGEYITEGPFSESPLLETIVWPAASSADLVVGFNGCEALSDSVISSLPAWAHSIGVGAFSNCSFTNIEIPSNITTIGDYAFAGVVPESIVFSEDGGALSIGAYAFAVDASYSTGAAIIGDDVVIDLPMRVDSVGPKAFEGLRSNEADVSPTFVIHNPDIAIGAAEDEWPIDAAKGATVRYPANAGESFMAFKAAVEAYEAGLEGTFNPTIFEPEEEDEPAAVQHSISVTAPAGATMQLMVNSSYVGEAVSKSPLTAKADEGSLVAVVVSMDGYKDYIAQPVDGVLTEDWTCTVAESDLTPITDTGSISVRLTKAGKATQRDQVAALLGSTVAVFDAQGKLVAQDKAPTSLVVHADALVPGAYTVVAFEKNDSFQAVNSLDDFARLGVKDGSWATGTATVKAGKIAELSLQVPDLQMLSAEEVLASGDVIVPDSAVVPDYTFYARIDYAMVDGHEADTLTVNIPEGIELDGGAYTTANRYGMAGYDAASNTLVVSLKGDDRQSGSLYVGMKVADPGSYNISAAIASGAVVAPVGSATVEAPALRLKVPETELLSPTFTAVVYAAPNTTVHFKIGDTELDTTATTNRAGVGEATLTIPEAELSKSYVYVYGVTAMLLDEDGNVTDQAAKTVDYPIVKVSGEGMTEWELSFKHAGQEVFLVKDGQVVPNPYYTAVMSTHNPLYYQPTWPFKAVFHSYKPLAGEAKLVLGMLDGTVKYHDMLLTDVIMLDGKYIQTYQANVPIGTGNPSIDLTARDIPCGFEVIPSFAEEGFDWPKVTRQNMMALQPLFNEPLAVRVNWAVAAENNGLKEGEEVDYYYQYAPDAYEYLLEQGIDMEQGNVMGISVFGSAYKHEIWDTDGSVWKGLSPEERQSLIDFENAMDAFLKAWQEVVGSEKPMNEYADTEEYITSTCGWESGEGAPDPDGLRQEGWQVYENEGAAGGNDPDWIAMRYTPSDDFGADIVGGGDVTKYKDKVDPATLTEFGNGMMGDGRPADYQKLADPTKPVDPKKGSGTIECIQAHDNSFDKFNRTVSDVPSSALAGLAIAQNNLGAKTADAATLLTQKGSVAGAKVAAGASKLTGMTSIATTGISMHQNHIAMAQVDNRLYNYGARSLDLAYELMTNGIRDTECGKALINEGLALYRAGYLNLSRRTFLTVDNVVSLELMTLQLITAEEPPLSKFIGYVGDGWTILSQAGDNFFYKPLANYSKSLYDKYAAEREEDCVKGRKTAHGANVIVDPSGWVYEAVDDNRLEGVKATVYELVGNVWERWEATAFGQENGQATGSWGIFGWDVPQGTWKVVFQKDGYSDATAIINGEVKDAAETDPMDVLPQYRNIAVGLVSTQPPAVVSTSVDDNAAVAEFSQYMKTATVPTVTIDGNPVAAAWVDAVEGTNSLGENELMAKALSIPLPEGAEPGDVLHVTVTGGENYAGTAFDSCDLYITVPGEAPTYYYVQPDADPVFTKGSTEALSFTFKRTLNDEEKTFPNFEGALVDGKAIELGKDYTAVAGSVVISLNASFLETLDVGDHTLSAQFVDGDAVPAAFAVKAASDEKGSADTKPAPANTTKSSTTSKSAAAKTGDTLPVALFVGLALASALVLMVTRRRRRPVVVGKHARR